MSKIGDEQKGIPFINFRGTKTDIEALAAVTGGMFAFGWTTAPETDGEYGYYDEVNTVWVWGFSMAFDLAAAIHAATEETSLHADDEVGIWEHVSGLLRRTKFSTWITDLGSYFVSHSSSTAANDVLVGSGTGAWIKKTLAEFVTILRTALDSVYAAISHTHAAGDVSGVIPTNGWILGAWASPTRVSATVFTVAEDVTAFVEKGTKLKFTDTTTKYLPVLSATFGAGVTTITTYATTDYAFVGNPSAIYFSNIEKPFGWPDWFNYTATPTASGSMTVTAYTIDASIFRVAGKTTYFKFRVSGITLGGTASTQVIYQPPTTMGFGGAFTCTITDTSATVGRGVVNVSTGLLNLRVDAGNWTLGTGKLIQGDGSYT